MSSINNQKNMFLDDGFNGFSLIWKINKLKLDLKFPWKIARGECSEKTNFIVELGDEKFKGKGEVAFNKRYDESEDKIQVGFEAFLKSKPSEIDSVKKLYHCLDNLEIPSSLRFGIESAFYDYISRVSGKNVFELLGINSIRTLPTSFSIPIMKVEEISKFVKKYQLNRFKFLKLKIGEEESEEKIKELMRNFEGQIRLDANESFNNPDEVIKFVESIDEIDRIQFIEQPLPAHLHDDALYLKKNLNLEIIADESLTDQEITDYYKNRFDGINVKLMKSGGYLKAIKQINDSKKLGLKVMVGCMIETSLSISAAMVIAKGADYIDLDGCLLIKEDPFSFLGEENGRLIKAGLQ
ncbi:MAG: dipeptide epimerase [Halobacteriovoraceae bacterium]|nr:dipeptide epimerase [Halobacteriovoraceae bacterium]